MYKIEVDKILEDILFKIDLIKYNGQYPNKIIIGAEVFNWLEYYLYDLQQYNDSGNVYKLYGIPVMINYTNPWNVEVCICFKVDVNNDNVK